MKYGQQFERESAPQWSLHNIDYNSLKHHIKVHTTKDQATAIAIPGHQDTALRGFEDDFFAELCRQHDRVDLFVLSKADEIGRRLQHLSSQIHRLLVRWTVDRRPHMSMKRQRRFAKYENELLQCGNDIQSLQRFVGAQVIAFRKILKKYGKWTGSSTLGSRFRENVLSHPKSFTKRDFSHLEAEYDNLLSTLRDAFPADMAGNLTPQSEASTPSVQRSEGLSPSETIAVPEPPSVMYWNEYDYGSEGGDMDRDRDDGFAIYINPDEPSHFPGAATLAAIFRAPIKQMNRWMNGEHDPTQTDSEHGPLLQDQNTQYGATNASYFTYRPGTGNMSDTEAEEDGSLVNASGRRGSYGYASSEEFPAGYKTYYAALPSIEEQHLIRYRERVLLWGTWAGFAASFLLMGIAALLIKTGRHKMRLEVDAGVTLGIMASLGAACAGLGMTFSRQEPLGWATTVAVWLSFATACVLNGILLILVVGNAPL